MTDTAIKVENLSKRYPSIKLRHSGHRRIGLEEEAPDTMAGALLNFLKQPGRNLRRLRRLTRFGDNGQGPDDEPEDVIWALKEVSFEVKRWGSSGG